MRGVGRVVSNALILFTLDFLFLREPGSSLCPLPTSISKGIHSIIVNLALWVKPPKLFVLATYFLFLREPGVSLCPLPPPSSISKVIKLTWCARHPKLITLAGQSRANHHVMNLDKMVGSTTSCDTTA